MRGGQEGFTLAEMAVALALAGVLLAMTLAAVGETLPEWRLREASGSVASTLRAGRALAIMDRTEVAVAFDVSRGRYNIVTRLPGNQSRNLRPTEFLPAGVRFVSPGSGNAVTLSPPDNTEPAAVFSARGLLLSSQTPGCVFLGNQAQGLYKRVCVNVVGNVKVQKWDGQRWQ